MAGLHSVDDRVGAVSVALCSRYNLAGHSSTDSRCPARSRVCRRCNRKGHFAICCRSSSSTNRANTFKQDETGKPSVIPHRPRRLETNNVTLTLDSVKESADWRNEFGIESENDFDMCANVNSLSDKNSPIFVNVQMAGESLRMMLDTGANVSLVPHSVWMSKWSHIPLKKSSCQAVYIFRLSN